MWGGFAVDEIAALVGGRAVTFRPRRLILAPGAHERPVPAPGWTLPGVMTTGSLQTLVRAHRVCPGERVLIAGSGPLNLQLACELLAGGVKPLAVIEAAPRPSPAAWREAWIMARTAPDLVREGIGMLLTLKRAGVPVLWSARVIELRGDGRVRTAQVAGHGFDRSHDVDVVALNLGFQPETGLARALGAKQRFVDAGLGHLACDTDEDGRTSVPGMFAVGDGASLGGARAAMSRGRLAGLAAARDLGRHAPDEPATRATPAPRTGIPGRAVDPVPTGRPMPRHADRRDRNMPLRGGNGRPPAPGTDRRPHVAAGAEEGHTCRHGALPGPLLRSHHRAALSRCARRLRVRSAARAAAPGAGRAADVRGAGIRGASARVPSPPARLHHLPPLAQETRRCDVLVMGGGLAGLCSAYFLARDGADVLLAERDEAGMAASTANAGSLHVQLLSYDFTNETPEDGGQAAHTLPLAPRSIALWKDFAAEAGEDLGIRTEGGLMLAEDAAGLDWLRRKSAMERRWGIESHVLGANELRALAPALSERMVGADFVPAEGYGDPLRGTLAVLKLAQRAGTRLLRGAEVQAIAREGNAWHVQTTKGLIVAGRVVNATGPWAGSIGRMVGLDLPVTGTVQQVIVTEPAPPMTKHLIALANRHLSLKQQASGGFLVGGGWFGGFDPASGRSHNLRRNIEGNLWVCARALPVLRCLSFVRAWTGINSSIDRAPILGEAPGLPGFFNAVSANGYTLGPIIGRLTADAVRGEAIDQHYRLERFG